MNTISKPQAVLITGAAGGIGRALCSVFRSAGYFVIATGRDVPAAPVDADMFFAIDLERIAAEPHSAAAFKDRVFSALAERPLYGLINNAAVQILGGTDSLSASDMSRSLNVNVVAPFVLSQLFAKALTAAGGSILNIGTVHARATKKDFVAYATSKTAMHGLTRALALDLGGKVRVNTLAPAATETPMLKAGFDTNPKGYADLAACHPAGRIASVDEIAKTALFLCSEDAGFITGATLYADGGILSRLHDPA